jgi:hypothetical protein
MADEQTCEVGSTLAPLATEPYGRIMYGYIFSENKKNWYSNSLYNV